MKITKNYNNIVGVTLIETGIQWHTISIFSWIHWDETSGVIANELFLEKIINWEVIILKWKLIIVKECNKKAIKLWKREVKMNLNRLFKDNFTHNINDYEESRSVELMSILKESDYLLDLHSTSWESIPFIFSEIQNFDLAKKLWISHIILWWNDLWWVISWDTESYINSKWWAGFTFEAWNHNSPDWKKNSYQMILNFLSTLEVIDYKYFKKIWWKNIFIKLEDLYIAKSDNFKYSIDVENFTKIKSWNIIWVDSWENIYSKNDMFLIMPMDEKIVKKWKEIFFIWKEVVG